MFENCPKCLNFYAKKKTTIFYPKSSFPKINDLFKIHIFPKIHDFFIKIHEIFFSKFTIFLCSKSRFFFFVQNSRFFQNYLIISLQFEGHQEKITTRKKETIIIIIGMSFYLQYVFFFHLIVIISLAYVIYLFMLLQFGVAFKILFP